MFGTSFYQPSQFYAVSHGRINVLTPKFSNSPFVNIFISECIAKGTEGKYEYNNMCSQKRVQRQSVMLPTTNEGEPDWGYMEQYAKNLMLKKYQQYLEFLEGRTSKN